MFEHVKAGTVIPFRVDNGLERFNRRLNEKFPTAHPQMVQFVDTLRELCCEVVRDMRTIEAGLMDIPPREGVNLPSIPEDYLSFGIVEPMKTKKGKGKGKKK